MKTGDDGDQSLVQKYIRIGLVVTVYWVVSISMVFVNKYILSDKDVNLDAPLFVTFYQCLCSIIICLALSLVSKLWLRFDFPTLHLKFDVMRNVMPLSVMFVAMITCNNLCLKYVGVAFYFVGRSLTTVFNVILTYAILNQKTSYSAIACCLVIILGFFLGVEQEGNSGSLSYTGVLFGVAASLFVSLNSIYTKKVLPSVDNNIWLLTFYNNVNAVILFIPMMVFNGDITVVLEYRRLYDFQFWNIMTLSGIFGFAIAYVTGLQIKVTSPLTHNISGTAKACFQTVLAVIWFHEIKSLLWWLSNCMVIFGSGAYARVKQLEMERSHKIIQYHQEKDQLIKETNE